MDKLMIYWAPAVSLKGTAHSVIEELAARVLRDQDVVSPVRFGRAAHGKPFLPDDPRRHFNGSHSGGIAVCAFWERPLGIDLQKVSARPRAQAIARRLMHPNEGMRLAASADAERLFFRLWAQKEAVMKATGDGFALPMNRFEVRQTGEGAQVVGAGLSGWTLAPVPGFPGFEAWVCVRGAVPAMAVRALPLP
ncbi:4'-phosphopantetheinyl transferase family protein [Pseudoramibacter faecis]|uniref:4'-phosphopantetheinyl transferase family protein n=1 Tax=Pseudoramibacter faecis TaxID=3108534 RepID=UPI002E795505|nr:4'-phosphopantetheinyl transferase superfamily protein [Pseudoramibacter sp. HA2172]